MRAARVEELEGLLTGLDGISLLAHDPRVTARTYYNLVLRLDLDRFGGGPAESVARALAAELGTAVNPVYVPLNRHRLLRPIPGAPELPVAEEARRTCVALTHPVLLDTPDGMRDIAEALHKVQRHAADLARVRAPEPHMAF